MIEEKLKKAEFGAETKTKPLILLALPRGIEPLFQP